MTEQIWADHDSISIDLNHHYKVDGIKGWMPSCSTIAKHSDAGSSDSLLNWAAEIGIATGDSWGFKESNKESLNIGSEVHKEIHEHIVRQMQSPQAPEPEMVTQLYLNLIATMGEYRPYWIATELKNVRTDMWYGGTVDAVAVIDDYLVILDWKTAKQYTRSGGDNRYAFSKPYATQVAGYHTLLEANESFLNKSTPWGLVGDYFDKGKVKAKVVCIYKDHNPEIEGSKTVEMKDVNLPNGKKTFTACLDVYKSTLASSGGLYVK